MIKIRTHPFPGVTIIDTVATGHRELQAGDLFTYPPDCGDGDTTYEAVSVTSASAFVRAQRRVPKEIIDQHTGEVRSFETAARGFQISRHSFVTLVEREGA